MSSLYTLEINPLSVASFASIFSRPVGCLFILFTVSFAVRKLSSLQHLLIFVFISITPGDRSKKKYCCDLCQRALCFSFRSLVASSLIFRSPVHSGLCVCGVRDYSNLALLHGAVQPPSTAYSRDFLFSIVFSCCLCHPSSTDHGVWVDLWAFCPVPLMSWSVFVPVPHCLDDCSSVVQLEARELIPPAPFFFLTVFWLVGVFCVSRHI